jgi:hypothetical protein
MLKGNQEEDHLESKYTDGSITLNLDLKSSISRHEVNNLAQDFNKFWAALNKVNYIKVPENVGNFWSS